MASVQYDYSGKTLRTFSRHSKSGGNGQAHRVLTTFTYDHAGRVLTQSKRLDSLEKTETQFAYNELGQLSQKTIGNGLETQDYDYNIRGWMTGINSGYTKAAENTRNFFGEIISYDSGFVHAQYNGNIAGIRWKSFGDGLQRAYGFDYDNANRLKLADFSQKEPDTDVWSKNKVDYTVSGLIYDLNGNILTMQQRGLKVGSSTTIDSLTYSYFPNSNLLKSVSDAVADNSPLGDFKDTATTGDDYGYDINGNIIKDNNRHMHGNSGGNGAAFNLLDKPDSILIAGKSKTKYIYDAAGATLRKEVTLYNGATTTVNRYDYIAGFVYLNDTLQYAMTEEGRIRYAKKRDVQTGDYYYAYENDYFLRDHQGNVRSVITDGVDTTMYKATMEPALQTTEDALFANIYTPTNTVQTKPTAFDSESANTKVSRLNGSNTQNKKMGPSLVLKVMAGDKVQMSTYAFYNTAVQQPQSGVNLLNDLLSLMPGALIGSSGGKLITGITTALNNVLNPNVTQFLNDSRDYDDTKPKAYLNWILFDEQFNFIEDNSGVKQVQPGSSKQPLVAPLHETAKNGVLYIYLSNESPMDVYFDDLTVQHFTGPLMQE